MVEQTRRMAAWQMLRALEKFEIFVGADGQFYFHLKAENGLIIAASQGYTTKQSAQNGIEAIMRVASQSEVVYLTSNPSTSDA